MNNAAKFSAAAALAASILGGGLYIGDGFSDKGVEGGRADVSSCFEWTSELDVSQSIPG